MKVKSGKINGVEMDFLSHIPYINQTEFSFKNCCDSVFNPNDLITTYLGDGVVEEATVNFNHGKINIKLLH